MQQIKGAILKSRIAFVRERFGVGRENVENRPVISEMLNRREALGLSADQVKKIEQLRDNFEHLSIRNNAELRIVELDIDAGRGARQAPAIRFLARAGVSRDLEITVAAELWDRAGSVLPSAALAPHTIRIDP